MSEGPSSLPPVSNPPGDDAGDAPLSVGGTAKTIAFIILIQIFAISITKVNAPAIAASGVTYQPGGTSTQGSIVNVLILVAFVLAATVAGVWLARKRRVKLFTGAIFFATSVALFLLTLLAALDLTENYLSANLSVDVSLVFASTTIVVLVLVSTRKIPAWSALFLTGLLSAEVGSYFASTIPILTALLLPIGFSLYDIYTVFRGPLRTLVTTLPQETLNTISSKIGDFSIGTGDTVFYAMIPCLAYYQFSSLNTAFASLVAVDAGVVLTLYLLGKVKLLPGLPIPMVMGLAVLLAFYFR